MKKSVLPIILLLVLTSFVVAYDSQCIKLTTTEKNLFSRNCQPSDCEGCTYVDCDYDSFMSWYTVICQCTSFLNTSTICDYCPSGSSGKFYCDGSGFCQRNLANCIETNCEDGIDNDQDGKEDMLDNDCVASIGDDVKLKLSDEIDATVAVYNSGIEELELVRYSRVFGNMIYSEIKQDNGNPIAMTYWNTPSPYEVSVECYAQIFGGRWYSTRDYECAGHYDYQAWRAFDNIYNSGDRSREFWRTGSQYYETADTGDTNNITFDFGLGNRKKVDKIVVHLTTSQLGRWSLEASNDKVNWNLLTEGINTDGGATQITSEFPGSLYRYYKFNTFSSTAGVTRSARDVKEIKFYEEEIIDKFPGANPHACKTMTVNGIDYDNTVLWLTSKYGATAIGPEFDPGWLVREERICYGDMSCTLRQGDCEPWESCVVTLENFDNFGTLAKCDSSDPYPNKICCSENPVPPCDSYTLFGDEEGCESSIIGCSWVYGKCVEREDLTTPAQKSNNLPYVVSLDCEGIIGGTTACEHSAGYELYRAFDNDYSTRWSSPNLGDAERYAKIIFDFGENNEQVANRIKFGGVQPQIKDWSLSGSNDKSNWNELISGSFSRIEDPTFEESFSNNNAYRYYLFKIDNGYVEYRTMYFRGLWEVELFNIASCEGFTNQEDCWSVPELNCTWTPPGANETEGGCCPQNLPIWDTILGCREGTGDLPCTIPLTLTIIDALRTQGEEGAVDVIRTQTGNPNIESIYSPFGPLDKEGKKYCAQVTGGINYGLWYPIEEY